MKKQNHLFILSGGRVAAIDRKLGQIVWEVKLKTYAGSTMASSFGQIMVEDNNLFIGSAGMLLCLSTKDGALIWKNELKGWGYNFVSIANAPADAGIAAASQAAGVAAVAASS